MIVKKIWISIIAFIFTLIFSLIIIIIGLFDKKKIYTGKASRWWAIFILKCSFIKYNVIGKEKISDNNNYVLVSNHQSAFDILVAFASLKIPIAFLTKKELFYIPIFGWAMKSAGMVYVDRFNKEKSKYSVSDAITKINNTSLSILVYPESTRTAYNKLKDFKKGAFILAIESKKPIVPLTLIYNKDPRLSILKCKITLLVDEPIDSVNYNIEQKDNLLVKVRESIKSNLKNTC